MLTEVRIFRNFQLEFEVLLQEHGFSNSLLLVKLVFVDGVLVEIVFCVEVPPNCEGEEYCLLDPTDEALSDIP